MLWWLLAAYPAAAQLRDNRGQVSILPALLSVLLGSLILTSLVRVVYVRFGRRVREGVFRVALTSPWMWVIAGVSCVVELLGQLPQSGAK